MTKYKKESTDIKKRILHNFIMAAIMASGAGIRILLYKSLGKAIEVSDTPTYLDCAMSLYYHLGLSEYRPPVYPLGIMLMGTKYGWANLSRVMPYLQSLIGLANVVIIFKLVHEAFKNRTMSYIVSFMCAIGFSIYNWDLVLLSENFSILFATSIIYNLVLFFNRKVNKYLYFSFFWTFTAIYTKPFFLLFPLVIPVLVAVRYLLLKDIQIKNLLKPLILCISIIYGSIFLYSGLHYAQTGYFGFSSVGNVNLLGKVMQYDMAKYIPELEADVEKAMNNENQWLIVDGKFPEPWNFVGKYGYRENHYEEAGKYAKKIILGHPFEFMIKSTGLTFQLIQENPFKDYIAVNALANSENKSKLLTEIKKITDYFENLYPLILLSVLECIYLIFFAGKSTKEKMFPFILIVAAVLYHYAIAAFFSYGDYPRLLAPSYCLIYIIMAIYPARFISFLMIRTINLYAA